MIIRKLRFSLFFFVFASLFSLITKAQESAKQKSDDFWHRVSVGGYVSLQLGNATGIVIAPEAQVRIIDQLYGGLGLSYQYYWYKNYYWYIDRPPTQYLNYSASVYGGRIFFRYYLRSLFDNFLGNVFAHTEYEYLYYTRPVKQDLHGNITDGYSLYSQGKEVMEINSIFVGGGYSQPVGGKAFIDIMILFNLNDSYNSPYSNPVFRIGFGVGL
jgi:hypothetical protein